MNLKRRQHPGKRPDSLGDGESHPEQCAFSLVILPSSVLSPLIKKPIDNGTEIMFMSLEVPRPKNRLQVGANPSMPVKEPWRPRWNAFCLTGNSLDSISIPISKGDALIQDIDEGRVLSPRMA